MSRPKPVTDREKADLLDAVNGRGSINRDVLARLCAEHGRLQDQAPPDMARCASCPALIPVGQVACYDCNLYAVESVRAPEPAPIPMLLVCPTCGERHIDTGEFATRAHHTHACQNCGMVWRPALVPTVGVQFLPGFKNADDDQAS